MALPSKALVDALRETARRLRIGVYYAWGHHGACNCGNLVQVVTQLTDMQIVRYAQEGIGEWTELAREFCPDTNAPIQLIIHKLVELGLTPSDIHHLEYLTDRAVLEKIPGGFRWLVRNQREDVILYFETFAGLLDEQINESARTGIFPSVGKPRQIRSHVSHVVPG